MEETLEQKLARLEAENQALKGRRSGNLSLKVSEKGGLSVYGMGRFPTTLYREQWEKLLSIAEDIREFIRENDHSLKKKEWLQLNSSQPEATWVTRHEQCMSNDSPCARRTQLGVR